MSVLKAQNWIGGKSDLVSKISSYKFEGPISADNDNTATFIIIKECNY